MLDLPQEQTEDLSKLRPIEPLKHIEIIYFRSLDIRYHIDDNKVI